MAPIFRSFGRKLSFNGPAHTLKVHEDNAMVRATLEQPGDGKVLVVDGGGSVRCALVGDRLAQLAIDNDWAGIIVSGAIRDSADIEDMPVGIRALATHPVKSIKRGHGLEGGVVQVAGVAVSPGAHIYADADGILVSAQPLTLPV